jgi:V8-like Glu-specific endopeptidase
MSHIFNVKRLQPGQVIELSDQARTFSHDCFTLGGNSGSPVVDLETFQVLGLHFAGRLQPDRQTKINEAVALWHLIDDPLLQENRINFD